jgi:hypothetical protein
VQRVGGVEDREGRLREGEAVSEQPKPFAWAVIGDGYEYATLLAEHAGAVAEEEGGRVVPLYRDAPPPALTDAEREAVECGIELIREWHAGDDPKRRDATLRGLLERLGGQT